MTDKTISELPSSTPLSGVEIFPVVQSGITTKTTAADIKTFISAEPADATILKQANIVNALDSTSTTSPLSAAQGKVLADNLAIAALALSGPTECFANSTRTWFISDYDAFSTYTLSTSSGSISRTNDLITFTAPPTPGAVILTLGVNGSTRTVNVTILQAPIYSIGMPGNQGFGLSAYPNGDVPTGFTELTGTTDPTSDNYGNYQYSDGSIMCWIPKFYYRIGSADSPRYEIYGNNAIDIASAYDFFNEAAANAAGYALHRAFKNGGEVKSGFMADKYQCSNNAGVAGSIKYGNPLSSSSSHNPFSNLKGAPANYYFGAIDAAKTRGSKFHCMSRFQFAALALLATAHGQAATSSTYCAWYDATLVKNFPKGNNNALNDINDTAVKWQTDGVSGKTGSAGYGGGVGNLFAKSTHNGQNSGVADLNGNMWEINLGMTRPGISASDASQQNDPNAFYLLKESVDVNSLTSDWSDQASGNASWGTATHLATLYDAISLAHISNAAVVNRYGNSTNQVLEKELSGNGWRMAGFGIPKSGGVSVGGTNLFGQDLFYEYHSANLCLISGGSWGDSTDAGVWSLYLGNVRAYSYGHVGFRAAAYV